MALITYTPFDIQINRLFDEALETRSLEVMTNVWEDAEQFSVQMALPGWESQALDIKVEDAVLTVRAGQEEKTAQSARKYLLQEWSRTPFSRSFVVPSQFDTEKANASFKDGVLTIDFSKREEAKPRQISIG